MLQPKYPQKTLLPKITDHEVLPFNAVEFGRIQDRLNNADLLIFLKIEGMLVIVDASGPRINGDHHYIISQFEAPLGVLPWFVDALTEFRRPPADRGLPAGAMTSADQDVEGEMLCIQRAMGDPRGHGGYVIVNRSRPDRLYSDFGGYRASSITFDDNFLFQGGLLQLISELGEKYKKGLL